MTYDFYCKSLLLLSILLFSFSFTFGQINVQYESSPTGGQMYQRDGLDKAKILFKGKLFAAGYTDISVTVKRDNKNYFYQKQRLSYQSSPAFAPFLFSTEIKAELSDYSFKAYLFIGKDSILLKEENEIVCGDVILVYGQSNALASDAEELERFSGDNKFGRTVYEFTDSGDYQWLPTQKSNYWSAGLLGLEVQKQLINKYKIPIAIINGAIGNKSIDELMIRDENNHANPAFYYGRLLKKAQTLGFANQVRAIIWRQGEWEAYDAAYKNDYSKKFDTFRKQILEDYPALKKIYTYQNNIYFYGGQYSGDLREYQRTVGTIYPDCEVLSTLGTLGFDGLHYTLEGYEQSGQEVSRLIARDFLNSTDVVEINSPNIKKAYFTSRKDSLILEFDANQKLTFPDAVKSKFNNSTINLKDYFYLDGKNVVIEKATASNNLVILKFKEPQIAKTVTYTPIFYTNEILDFLPGLPPIKNSRGVRALTFKDFPITSNSIPVETAILSGKFDNVSKKKIELSWVIQNSSNKSYFLEKGVNSPNFFSEISSLNSSTFIDYKVKKGVNYYYRLRINQSGINQYSNTIEIKIPFDLDNTISVSTDAIIVYPIPIQKGKDLNLDVLNDAKVKIIRLTDLNNTIVRSIMGDLTQYQYSIKTDNLNSGMYFIEAILEDNTKLIKKFVVE